MEPSRYADPLEEALSHGSQRVAQFSSLVAALSQVFIQRRALHDALAAGRHDDRTARALRQQQQALREQARLTWAPAHDPQWLAQADFLQTGSAWAGAASFADTDPAASSALRKCEDRLRHLHPYAMARYDRLKTDGMSPLDAMREAVPLFARSPHVRTGDPVAPRAALDADAAADLGSESAPGAGAEERAPGTDEQEQAERRAQQIAGRLQDQARANGRPPLGPDELAIVLATVTNLPEAVITKITHRAETSPPGHAKSPAQLAAECFPVTAADAVTASSTGRAKNSANRATLEPATKAAKPGRPAP
jgi:hypothetical protein